jgi:hypothetical protein
MKGMNQGTMYLMQTPNKSMYECVRVCIYIYIYIYVCVCVYIYIYETMYQSHVLFYKQLCKVPPTQLLYTDVSIIYFSSIMQKALAYWAISGYLHVLPLKCFRCTGQCLQI